MRLIAWYLRAIKRNWLKDMGFHRCGVPCHPRNHLVCIANTRWVLKEWWLFILGKWEASCFLPYHIQLPPRLPKPGLVLSPPKSMERCPRTSVKKAPYPQANVGERDLGRAMISLSVCIGCLLSHTEERWPPFPLFWFSVFNTAPGVISHLPVSWFKCLTQSHMFGSLIQSKIWPTSCENSLYHMCCKA